MQKYKFKKYDVDFFDKNKKLLLKIKVNLIDKPTNFSKTDDNIIVKNKAMQIVKNYAEKGISNIKEILQETTETIVLFQSSYIINEKELYDTEYNFYLS